MKQLLTLLVVLIGTSGWSQKLPKIKGSGILEVKEMTLEEPFNALSIDGDMDVVLVQGKENGYSIEVDDNLLEVVMFEVADNTLSVSLTHRIIRKKKFLITITSNTIDQIELKNESTLESSAVLTGEALFISAGKSTKYDLDIDYKAGVTVEMYSDAAGVLKSKAQINTIRLDDRASLQLYGVLDSLAVAASDNTKLTLDGTIEKASFNLKESAKIIAKDALLTTVDINLSAKADAVINAKETISLYAQDTSELQLYGDPEITIKGLKNKARILKRE